MRGQMYAITYNVHVCVHAPLQWYTMYMEDGYKRGVEFCATNSLNGVNCVYSTAGIIIK
jgi:hypothetical protein